MRRTLIVTNDFPPRQGGIQSFIQELALRLPADRLTVYAPRWDGDAEFDARQPFEVVRHPTSLMIHSPGVTRRAIEIARARNAETVIFGAAAPLGLITPALRRNTSITRAIAITHGHEAGWAALPVARQLLRRIGEHVDVVTYLGEYFRARLTGVIPAEKLTRLSPAVDPAVFRPDPAAGAAIRARHGLTGCPVVVCVSRLVPRKGQDLLIRAWPRVLARVPDATLLLVGGGSYYAALRRLADRTGVADHVILTGPVPFAELPAHYAAGDVFAMPCRTRRGGLDVEGLGIVYLEASATCLPAISGDSGGAPDAILEGETGYVVPGRDAGALAERIAGLLQDPAGARAMGEKGRAWVEREWTWDQAADRLRALIDG
ncbi:MAG TPA: glycosyltransferase family 4 protein [Trebonia sp.]|jgi:phosphatidylinositol alpha-1,6-mannosyltransferase|nr:glycosyltransferase family 4 protein [Trebonia sp.]